MDSTMTRVYTQTLEDESNISCKNSEATADCEQTFDAAMEQELFQA